MRSRGGAVPGAYHTGRFTKVPRLAKLLRVPTPADRGPGQPWRPGMPGTPPPAPIDPDSPTADIRIGYARCSTLTQELRTQLDALAAKNIPPGEDLRREDQHPTAPVRPQFEAALAAAREIKAHAPHCRVILTVYEMKRLGRFTEPHVARVGSWLERCVPEVWVKRLQRWRGIARLTGGGRGA